jgi:hypothetical protein
MAESQGREVRANPVRAGSLEIVPGNAPKRRKAPQPRALEPSERHRSMHAKRRTQNRTSFLHRSGAHSGAPPNRRFRTRQCASKHRRSSTRERIPKCANPIRRSMRPGARCGAVSTSRACRNPTPRARRFRIGPRVIFRRPIRARERTKIAPDPGAFPGPHQRPLLGAGSVTRGHRFGLLVSRPVGKNASCYLSHNVYYGK